MAGDFLERLGNRKSEFVVHAVAEYLAAHPDVLISGQKPRIVVKQSLSREQIEAIIRDVINEKMATAPDARRESGVTGDKAALEPYLDEMLKNIDMF
jgi:hypothetical protein